MYCPSVLSSPYEKVLKASRFKHERVMADAARRVKKREALDKTRAIVAKRRREQAALVKLDRIQGLSLSELAAKYQITERTVTERLRYADSRNLLDNYTKATVNDIVPKALAVFDAALSDLYHDVNKVVVETAARVLEGTGVIGRERATALVKPPVEDGDITTIEEYRALRIRRMQQPPALEGTVVQTAVDDEGGDREDSGSGEHGRGTVLHEHQAHPGGDLDSDIPQLPGGGDGRSEDPAGGHPQDP